MRVLILPIHEVLKKRESSFNKTPSLFFVKVGQLNAYIVGKFEAAHVMKEELAVALPSFAKYYDNWFLMHIEQ